MKRKHNKDGNHDYRCACNHEHRKYKREWKLHSRTVNNNNAIGRSINEHDHFVDEQREIEDAYWQQLAEEWQREHEEDLFDAQPDDSCYDEYDYGEDRFLNDLELDMFLDLWESDAEYFRLNPIGNY
jgi:hypothetical protein